MRTHHLHAIMLLGGLLVAPVTVARAASATHGISARAEPVLGIYQLSLVSRASEQRAEQHAEQHAELLIKGCGCGYCGYLLTGDHSVILDDLTLAGDTLHATVMTSAGRATVALRLDESGISGTLTVGGTTIDVLGARVA